MASITSEELVNVIAGALLIPTSGGFESGFPLDTVAAVFFVLTSGVLALVGTAAIMLTSAWQLRGIKVLRY